MRHQDKNIHAIQEITRGEMEDPQQEVRTTRYIYPTAPHYPEAILERGRQCSANYSRHANATELLALRRMVGALIRQAICLQEAIRKLEDSDH